MDPDLTEWTDEVLSMANVSPIGRLVAYWVRRQLYPSGAAEVPTAPTVNLHQLGAQAGLTLAQVEAGLREGRRLGWWTTDL
jgi:hypothetical protein